MNKYLPPEILVRRFCPWCIKVTKWKVAQRDKYWEVHTCNECKNHEEYKTR